MSDITSTSRRSQQLRKPGAPVVIAANGKSRVPDGIVLANGESTTAAGVRIEAIAAYDIKPGEPYHPKGEANGYIITLGGKRIYFAGVTECVPEIRALKNIDIAFFPMNVPLERMEPAAAVECLQTLRPKVVYPVSLRSGLGRAGQQRRAAARADDARARGAARRAAARTASRCGSPTGIRSSFRQMRESRPSE